MKVPVPERFEKVEKIMGTLKKVIGLGLAGLILLCLTAGGVWAYLQDPETSSSNQITAGTLDLKTDNQNGVTQTLYATALKPGASVGPSTIALRNIGSLSAATLNVSCSYVESDGSPNPVNKTINEVAAILQITQLDYDWDDLLPLIADGNSNGYKDIEDFKNSALNGLSGLNPAATKDFVITVRMRSGIANGFQADGIDITLTFVLNQ